MIQVVVRKVLWAAAVFGGLGMLSRGLWAGVYFERTPAAVYEADRGMLLIAGACCLLSAAAGYSWFVADWPLGLAIAVLLPVVLCGGLTWIAADSLLPQLSVIVAYPPALAAGIIGLFLRPAEGSATA